MPSAPLALFCIAFALLSPLKAQAEDEKASIAQQALSAAQTYDAEAKKAQALGKHTKAIEFWEKAYEQVSRPSFLFNIGQAYLDLQKCQKAIRFFENFINATQDVQAQAHAATLIKQTQSDCKEAPTTAPPGPKPGATPRLLPKQKGPALTPSLSHQSHPPSRASLMPYAWTSFGLGAGTVAWGTALIAMHIPIHRDGALLPEYRLTRTPGIALVSVGAALLLTGAILSIVQGTRTEPTKPAEAPSQANAVLLAQPFSTSSPTSHRP